MATAKQRRESAKRGAATRAANRAKMAGAVGDTRSKAGIAGATARVLRDTAIIARANSGSSTKAIAEEFEVTQRTVRNVLSAFRLTPSPLDQTPMQIVEELTRTYRRIVADFHAVAVRYADVHPSAAIGAMRQAREALRDYVDLLADLGKLPSNLELFRAESELIRLGELVHDRTEQVVAGEITAEQLLEFVEATILSHMPLPVVEGREIESGPRPAPADGPEGRE